MIQNKRLVPRTKLWRAALLIRTLYLINNDTDCRSYLKYKKKNKNLNENQRGKKTSKIIK